MKKPQARYDNSIIYGEKKRERNHSVMGTNNQSIKLPYINDDKYNKNKGNNSVNLKDLVNMMKIRKRDTKGYHEQNSKIRHYEPKKPSSERSAEIDFKNKAKYQYQPAFQTEKGSRQNPNLERNMQIIFPERKISNQKQ